MLRRVVGGLRSLVPRGSSHGREVWRQGLGNQTRSFAVPKKKISKARQRTRRTGQRMMKKKKEYSKYKMCSVCMKPYVFHTLNMECPYRKERPAQEFNCGFWLPMAPHRGEYMESRSSKSSS